VFIHKKGRRKRVFSLEFKDVGQVVSWGSKHVRLMTHRPPTDYRVSRAINTKDSLRDKVQNDLSLGSDFEAKENVYKDGSRDFFIGF